MFQHNYGRIPPTLSLGRVVVSQLESVKVSIYSRMYNGQHIVMDVSAVVKITLLWLNLRGSGATGTYQPRMVRSTA
jgi:hypothetical protein